MTRKRRKQTFRRSLDEPRVSEVITPEFVSAMHEARVAEHLQAQELDFDSVVQQLDQLLAEVNSMNLLASVCYHGQLRSQSDTGEYGHLDHISQFQLELLQAATLRRDNPTGPFPSPEQIVTATLGVTQLLRDLGQLDPTRPNWTQRLGRPLTAEEERADALALVRADAVIVRNWAMPSSLRRLLLRTWEPIDEVSLERFGFSICAVIELLFDTMAEVGRRLTDHARRATVVRMARTGHSKERQLKLQFPRLLDEPDIEDRLRELLGASDAELEVRAMLLADRSLSTLMTLTVDDLASLIPPTSDLDRAVIPSIFDQWSLSFSALAAIPFERIWTSNPVWAKPFILTPDRGYVLPIAASVQNFALPLIEAIVASDEDLVKRYQRQRSKYLEARTQELFSEYFPSADVTANVSFRPIGAVSHHETDLLVLVDDLAVVAELKSNRVRPAARRGAEGSVEDAIERLVVEPSEQAAAFASFLRQNDDAAEVRVAGQPRTIDTSRIERFLCLTITYEPLGMWAHPLALRDIGLIAQESLPSRPLLLTDAETILPLLPSQATRIDFLDRRDWMDRHVRWVGDDTDLVSLYLHNHLRVEAPPPDAVVSMTHHNIELQPYLIAQEHGWPEAKPKVEMTAWWRDVLTRVEERGEQGWLNACQLLLSVSPRTQREAARDVRDLTSRVRSGDSIGELVTVRPGADVPAALCLFAYDPRFKEQQLTYINELIVELAQQPGAPSRLVAMGFVPGRRLPQTTFTAINRSGTARK